MDNVERVARVMQRRAAKLDGCKKRDLTQALHSRDREWLDKGLAYAWANDLLEENDGRWIALADGPEIAEAPARRNHAPEDRSAQAVTAARDTLNPGEDGLPKKKPAKARSAPRPVRLSCGCYNCEAGKEPCLMSRYKS